MTPTRRLVGLFGAAGFAAAAVGGIGFGLLARSRAGLLALADDPEWRELERTLPAETHRVTSSDGTVLHVEVSGNPDGPTLLFAHGYALGLRAWHYQRRDLAREFRIVAYDQRGHGASGRAAHGDYSIGALGRDVRAVLDALAPGERVVAVGHSLGGMSLLAYASEHPEEVRDRLAGAVLLDTTGSDVVVGGLVTTGVAALSVLPRGIVAQGRRWRGGGEDPSGTPAIAPTDLSTLIVRTLGFGPDPLPAHVAFVEQLTVNLANSVKAELGPTLTASDLRRAPSRLRVPALVLVGEQDKLTPPAAAARLVRALPDARLVRLPGAGHNAMIEAHEAVTAHVRTFAHGAFHQARRPRGLRTRPDLRGPKVRGHGLGGT